MPPLRASYTEISPASLMRLTGTADAPLVIDVCTDEDFAQDPRLIPAALRCGHREVADLLPLLTGRNAVTVCQKGKKLSHGAAALLRSHGVNAEVLAGGIMAWRDAGLPMVPVKAIPAPQRGTLWVTRHRPKIDRIACPWLIRRFVDPQARFLYVPPAEVMEVAARFDATPFDMPGGKWGHCGTGCTFDTMIAAFGLSCTPLERLAAVVRAADTNSLDQVPQAAGLLAVSVGLSRLHKDDTAQLEAGMALYDALYRWARDGYEETHSWPEKHG